VAPVAQSGKVEQFVDFVPQGSGELDDFAHTHFTMQRGQHCYVSQIQEGLILVRMDLFERIGGFDEQFENSGLDWLDWCSRVRMAGSRLRIARDCFVSWGESIQSVSPQESDWVSLKAKWEIPESMSFEHFSDLPVAQSLFKDGRGFVPYQSEDSDLEAVLHREVKLLSTRNLRRQTA
jgi:hypothetical protein